MSDPEGWVRYRPGGFPSGWAEMCRVFVAEWDEGFEEEDDPWEL